MKVQNIVLERNQKEQEEAEEVTLHVIPMAMAILMLRKCLQEQTRMIRVIRILNVLHAWQ